MKRLTPVLHTGLTAGLVLLVYVVQVSLRLRVGAFAVIDLLPPLVVAAGCVLGSGAGMVCGLLAGLLHDVSGAGIEGIYPLYFMLCGILCGYLSEHHPRARMRIALLCAACTVGIISVLRYLFYFQFVTQTGIAIFALHIARRMVVCMLLCPIAILLVRLLGKLCAWRPRRAKRGVLAAVDDAPATANEPEVRPMDEPEEPAAPSDDGGEDGA